MNRIHAFLALGFLAVTLLVGGLQQVQAFPVPAIAPKSWELTFTHSEPKAIAVKDATGVAHWYWYMSYKVVNNTQADRLFVPDIDVATEQGDILTAGKNVPTHVFDAVKKHLGNTLLENPTQVVGKILQGEDFAKESLAIWPAFSHDVAHMSIFVAGLSGETQAVQAPGTTQDVLVVKTFMIDYDALGRSPTPQTEPLKLTGEKWIMR